MNKRVLIIPLFISFFLIIPYILALPINDGIALIMFSGNNVECKVKKDMGTIGSGITDQVLKVKFSVKTIFNNLTDSTYSIGYSTNWGGVGSEPITPQIRFTGNKTYGLTRITVSYDLFNIAGDGADHQLFWTFNNVSTLGINVNDGNFHNYTIAYNPSSNPAQQGPAKNGVSLYIDGSKLGRKFTATGPPFELGKWFAFKFYNITDGLTLNNKMGNLIYEEYHAIEIVAFDGSMLYSFYENWNLTSLTNYTVSCPFPNNVSINGNINNPNILSFTERFQTNSSFAEDLKRYCTYCQIIINNINPTGDIPIINAGINQLVEILSFVLAPIVIILLITAKFKESGLPEQLLPFVAVFVIMGLSVIGLISGIQGIGIPSWIGLIISIISFVVLVRGGIAKT